MRSLLLTMGVAVVVIASGCQKKIATVSLAPPTPQTVSAVPKPAVSLENLLNQLIDAQFDFNRSDLQNGALLVLSQDSNELKVALQKFPDAKFVVESYCDERGSAEYKLALCDRRATVVREFLIHIGIPAERLSTISYGTERPVCMENSEDCSQRNRRTHVAAAR